MRASHTQTIVDPGQSKSSARMTRANLTIALALFLLALAARLIFLFNSPDQDWPHSIFYEGDAPIWVEWATAIDTARPFHFNLPIHPPGVAYLIAWSYDGVRSSGFVGMKLLWCVMSALACSLTYLACVPAMSRRIAITASLMLVFSFNQYLLATSLNSETPYLMLLPMMVLLTLRWLASPARWTLALLGLTHGFALLLRPEHPILMLMLGTWMLLARPGSTDVQSSAASPSLLRRFGAVAMMGIISLLICLPWTTHAIRSVRAFNTVELDAIRFNLSPVEWTDDAQAAINALPGFARLDNYQFINHWAQRNSIDTLQDADIERFFAQEFGYTPRALSPLVLISNQGPFSFALANHPQTDGGFTRAALAHPLLGPDPSFAFAFPPHNRVFNDGWRVGSAFIRDDPSTWLRNVGRKFERFADGVTSGFGAANLPLNRTGVREPVDMFVSDARLALLWQNALLALIVTGIVLALVRRMPVTPWLLIILYKLIVTLAFYGYARQGASIAPAFFVFIAIIADVLLSPLDRQQSRMMRFHPAIAIMMCAALLAGDIFFSRRNEQPSIVGQTSPRPELISTPAASEATPKPIPFHAFNRIEIR